MMTFSSRTDRGVMIFDISGEVCIYNVNKLKEAIGLCLEGGMTQFIFNLCKVEYLDSTAIQYFLALSHELKTRGKLILTDVSTDILHTLQLCRAEKIFTIATNETQAFEQFAKIS
ncbi:MAG: STAS domain-containing protein [Candidatus Ozemobacteraceae bacterium]